MAQDDGDESCLVFQTSEHLIFLNRPNDRDPGFIPQTSDATGNRVFACSPDRQTPNGRMPTWNSSQYLKFNAERTQPAIDLARRVALTTPTAVIDLGCGPGNSTAVVAERWPGAQVVGLDDSAAMLKTARAALPQAEWQEQDIAAWAAASGDAPRFDVVYSNAALQWVPAHATLLPRLMGRVAQGGALAFQVPANIDAPAHRCMRDLAASPAWRSHFAKLPREWHVEAPEWYYDRLAPLATRMDIWTTDYFHVLKSIDDLVEWYRGTGLRPWLEALPDDATRTRFLHEYRELVAKEFPVRADKRVLFPFHRLFVVAYR